MITEFENVYPVGENLFYPNVRFASANTGDIFNPNQETIMSLRDVTHRTESEFTPSATKLRVGRCFFFVYNTDNYYHFVYDSLPYLINFLSLRKKYPHIKLLMNYPNAEKKEHYRFVLEFLAILDIHESDIEIIRADNEYSSVFVSDSFTHSKELNSPPREEIYELYRYIAVKLNLVHEIDFLGKLVVLPWGERGSMPEKIYISRRSHLHGDNSNIGTNYTTRRKMENEDELVDYLTTKGYTEVFAELLTTEEKIKMFTNATHVIGAIGGGLCNILFSLPSTKLTAIISPGFLDINKRFIYSINKVDLTLFTDTKHISSDEFKLYMRVKYGNVVGEIVMINDDKLTIMYSDSRIAGWNNNSSFKTIIVNSSDCIKLDNGLNSPWEVNLDKLKEIV